MANEITTFDEILDDIDTNADALTEIANEIQALQKTIHSRNITVEDWNGAVTGLLNACGGLVSNLKSLKDTINVTDTTKADISYVNDGDTALEAVLRNLVDQKVSEINTALNLKADADTVNTELGKKVDKVTSAGTRTRYYAVSAAGNQAMVGGTPDAIGSTLVERSAGGQSYFAEPSQPGHAATKNYVDNKITETKGYVDERTEGTVKSVNGVEPDEDGELTLQASDIGAAPVVGGKIPAAYIPGTYDDVIEGYYYNLKFYEEASHTTEITGEGGKLYVDITSNKSYRYTGSGYTAISDFDPSTIIVQGTGSAQDKVMSQNAVTTALTGVNNALASKANTSDVNTALGTKLDKYTGNLSHSVYAKIPSGDANLQFATQPYPKTFMYRDENGCAQVGTLSEGSDYDIVNRRYVNDHLGVSGEIELQASSWSNNAISVTVSALGANDAILLAPVSAEDKSALETANCIVSVENTTVTFTATETPTSDIYLNYFIVRGKT